MAKQVTDILRRKRADLIRDADLEDKRADMAELNAKGARAHARNMRELAGDIANSIRALDGPDARLDLPPESFS